MKVWCGGCGVIVWLWWWWYGGFGGGDNGV
jgi:hypothetical protein